MCFSISVADPSICNYHNFWLWKLLKTVLFVRIRLKYLGPQHKFAQLIKGSVEALDLFESGPLRPDPEKRTGYSSDHLQNSVHKISTTKNTEILSSFCYLYFFQIIFFSKVKNKWNFVESGHFKRLYPDSVKICWDLQQQYKKMLIDNTYRQVLKYYLILSY